MGRSIPEEYRSVLVVEDDELVQLRLESLLEAEGYRVITVSGVAQALEAAAAVFFPLIIVDRVLGDGDGAALCTRLRRRESRSRVLLLMLSGRDSELDIASGLRAGADIYLSKRTSDVELLAYIDAAIAAAHFASKTSF
jgi:two-component system OmpR family response regulator